MIRTVVEPFIAEPQPNVGWDKLASSAGPPETGTRDWGGPALDASLSHPTKCSLPDKKMKPSFKITASALSGLTFGVESL